jgi:hypothetical protein
MSVRLAVGAKLQNAIKVAGQRECKIYEWRLAAEIARDFEFASASDADLDELLSALGTIGLEGVQAHAQSPELG